VVKLILLIWKIWFVTAKIAPLLITKISWLIDVVKNIIYSENHTKL